MGQYTSLSLSSKSYMDQSPEEILENTIKERDAFLNQHPNLKAYQKEIDRIVINAGSIDNRMAVLGMMIEAKFIELRTQISYLLYLTQKIKRYQYLN